MTEKATIEPSEHFKRTVIFNLWWENSPKELSHRVAKAIYHIEEARHSNKDSTNSDYMTKLLTEWQTYQPPFSMIHVASWETVLRALEIIL